MPDSDTWITADRGRYKIDRSAIKPDGTVDITLTTIPQTVSMTIVAERVGTPTENAVIKEGIDVVRQRVMHEYQLTTPAQLVRDITSPQQADADRWSAKNGLPADG